jgi:hypothetical protein
VLWVAGREELGERKKGCFHDHFGNEQGLMGGDRKDLEEDTVTAECSVQE